MPAPIVGAAAIAAARLIAKKIATRTAGGITGTGAKNVNPVYKQIESKGKKQAAGFAAGAGATAAWVGSQINEHMKNPHFNPKKNK